MFKRAIYNNISQQLRHKNAIVITGMRQVGKTTLMKQLAGEWDGKKLWYDFDNPLDMLIFENISFQSIHEELRREAHAGVEERFLVCIDEIQNFPGITKVIKYLIDHYGTKFIVTGSSNYYLRNLFPESLSGRKFLFVLHPLSYREYLHFNGCLSEKELEPDPDEAFATHSKAQVVKRGALYEEYLEFGGFPEVTATSDHATKRLILRNIFVSFFEKDIKVFNELKDVRELRDLILLLGPRNGNMLDVSRLASEMGINRVKAYSYLEFLEGTFFLRLIPKYSKSADRRVAGGKKVYFSDTGILNMVAKVTPGQLLETAVANQLQPYGDLSFYNRRNTAEIDFILNNSVAVEVKQKAIAADVTRLAKISGQMNLSRHYVASKTAVEPENIIYPCFF
jgi:predicted AAA+ superfamily ATPase